MDNAIRVIYVGVCGRCEKEVDMDKAEYCWYCIHELCVDCWDKYGHCGHPEADELNELAASRGG